MPIIKIKNCLNCHIAHEWFFDGADLKELRVIKRMTGMNGQEFAAAGDTMDPDALAALLVVLHTRDKITVSYDDVNLDFGDFEMEPTEEEAQAIAALEEKMKAAADKAQAPKVSLAKNGRPAKAALSAKSEATTRISGLPTG